MNTTQFTVIIRVNDNSILAYITFETFEEARLWASSWGDSVAITIYEIMKHDPYSHPNPNNIIRIKEIGSYEFKGPNLIEEVLCN